MLLGSMRVHVMYDAKERHETQLWGYKLYGFLIPGEKQQHGC